MQVSAFDHIVLCVSDIEQTLSFYSTHLGMEPREERSGKWALHFGIQKISLQSLATLPEIAQGTTPGSANFCLLTQYSVDELAEQLRRAGIDILAGPDERIGAIGAIRSIYFRDPDGNLVEISNAL